MMNRPGYSDGFATPLTVCGEFSSLYVTTYDMSIEMTFLFKYTYTLFILFYSKMRPRK